jgi:hypothetical protein
VSRVSGILEAGSHMRTFLAPIVVFLVIVVLGVTVSACVADARRRGKSPLMVTVAVILFFPWGLVAWLLFRPQPLEEIGARPQFTLEDHRVQ